MKAYSCVGLVSLLVSIIFATQAFPAKNILYIFDASGSMSAKMEGRAKIAIAQQVLSDQVQKLPDSGINAGLMVYGHRRKGDCTDIEEVVKLKPLEKKELITKIKSIHPKGQTPIANSIRAAAENLKELEEETTIILISDGKETCDPNPCGAVQQLKEAGINFVLHVIGFDVTEEEKLQLQCIAKAGGGVYEPADTAGKLDEAIKTITKIPVESIIKAQENIEVILDTSNIMNKAFSGKTKYEAAVQGLNKVLNLQVAEGDNLALRHFGGPCRGQNTKLLVNFGQNNADRIREALGSLRIDGETTTADAIIKAIKDFDDINRFEGVSKRALIITGGNDSCNPRAPEDIRRELQSKKIRPDFWFIGMDVPSDQQRQLNEIQRVTGAHMFFVKNQEELENVLERLFEIEPVIADIKTMMHILNSVIEHFNGSGRLIEKKDYLNAENLIKQGKEKFKETNLAFQDLGKRLKRDDFIMMYNLVKENRELQVKLLDIVESRIPLAKGDDRDAYNSSVENANEMVSTYNSNIQKIDEILRRLPAL
jgi:Mg-chelatase subunit ChlD